MKTKIQSDCRQVEMQRPRRSTRTAPLEKKPSISSSTSNPIPSPPSPPQQSNQDEPAEPPRLLEPRECVGRTIQIGLNDEIELIFKNPPSSETNLPALPDLKTQKSELVPYENSQSATDPPKFH